MLSIRLPPPHNQPRFPHRALCVCVKAWPLHSQHSALSTTRARGTASVGSSLLLRPVSGLPPHPSCDLLAPAAMCWAPAAPLHYSGSTCQKTIFSRVQQSLLQRKHLWSAWCSQDAGTRAWARGRAHQQRQRPLLSLRWKSQHGGAAECRFLACSVEPKKPFPFLRRPGCGTTTGGC